ncbi:MAG: hypothetical protein ACP5XB_17550 [Isosphaeraceae bacterium]
MRAALFRRLIPAPGDPVFALVLLIVLIGGRNRLFNDPGTLWHLRLGRDILATGTVPQFDTLTFTHAHEPWVDQSWAFDVTLALVVDHGGWPAAAALTALLLAAVYSALARGLIRDGISPVVSVIVTLLMAAIGCIHFLVRPHIITLALVYLTFRICQKQHERGGWSVAWVPVLTAIVANVHGGFLALPGIVATAAVAHAVSGPWDQVRRQNVTRFVLVFLASLLAALINPYGLDLYRHVYQLLVGSGVTGLIQEYQPAPFGTPETQVLEIVLLAFMALPALVSRKVDRYHLVHLLVWLHLALTHLRNAPLFAFAAAPALATLADGLPITFRSWWTGPQRRSIWAPALATALLAMVAFHVNLGGFDRGKWPFSALATLNRQPPEKHLFNDLEWGGLVAAETRPVHPSFVDDRFEIFGKAAIVEYIEALSGGPTWDVVRDRDRIELVWVRPDCGLAKRVANDEGWTELFRDSTSVLFGRKTAEQLLTSSHP